MKIYDLIGIGFGPSNIALAISLEEHYAKTGKEADVLFLEKQESFAWHPNMMLNHSHMQVSFLKDLVTPRNPTSKYSFLNYLSNKNRLQDFINLQTFFPSRNEFNDYLKWCASHFDNQCHYDRQVVSITPINTNTDEVELLKVISCDHTGKSYEYIAKSVVVAVGGKGNIPKEFAGLEGDDRVFHSSTYLTSIKKLNNPQRVAVIGAGQSSAEIFMDLHDSSDAQVDLITRSWAFKPSDDSPFANEIFNPEYTDYVFNNSTGRRNDLLKEYRSTNYAAPDLEVIENIYNVFYQQKVNNEYRHSLFRRYEVKSVETTEESIILTIQNLDSGETIERSVDAVILATGYQRNIHQTLLQPVEKYLKDYSVTRDYRICANDKFKPVVFLQGCCESTHGLSDTLLSNISVRNREICESFERDIMSKKEVRISA